MEGRMPSSRQVVAALTLTTALLLVGACDGGNQGGSESITTSTGTGSEGSRRTTLSPPANGQVDGFTWALPFEATSLDPIKSWAPPENTILANLCESVLKLTPELRPEPGLASNIDTSDPTKVVLTVRGGVTFWDGSPMTAEDVAFSLSRNLEPKLGGVLRPLLKLLVVT
jgi:peptide/nickel transport system substrate-binding protein